MTASTAPDYSPGTEKDITFAQGSAGSDVAAEPELHSEELEYKGELSWVTWPS